MGDFSDDYGGYDMLGIYERHEDERTAQRAKLLTPPQSAQPMHPEIKKMYEDYFDKCFRESFAAQRPWVGMTDQRVKEIWLKGKDHGDDWLDVLALARLFEAELKELNK